MSLKITFIASSPAFPISGATLSMFERLSFLKKNFSWEASVFCLCDTKRSQGLYSLAQQLTLAPIPSSESFDYELSGITARLAMIAELETSEKHYAAKSDEAFSKHLNAYPADILFFNVRDAPASHFAQKVWKGASLGFLTENEFPKTRNFRQKDDMFSAEELFSNLKNVVVATKFLASSFESSWGITPHIFTNCLDLERLPRIHERGLHITILHPFAHKGIDICLGLAKELPFRKFLVAGGVGAEYRKLKPNLVSCFNVKHYPFSSDRARIYANSRIVLVPSLWEEAFSRVVIEAMHTGIPVLASDVGGLKEAGGSAATYFPVNKKISADSMEWPPQDLEPWKAAVIRLDEPAFYQQRVEAGFARIAEYVEARDEDLRSLDILLKGLIEDLVT